MATFGIHGILMCYSTGQESSRAYSSYCVGGMLEIFFYVRMICFNDVYSTTGGGIADDLWDRGGTGMHTAIYESGGETGEFCSPIFLHAKVLARQNFSTPKF